MSERQILTPFGATSPVHSQASLFGDGCGLFTVGTLRRDARVCVRVESPANPPEPPTFHIVGTASIPRNRPKCVLAAELRSGHAPGMTSEQRDFLRKAIDAQMRERVERGRNAKAEASRRL
jgi:hypothetical protein